MIPNNIFLNQNELSVKAHFWTKAATSLVSRYLLLASGTHRRYHHVCFTDWMNGITEKPCRNWPTKSYIPLIVKLYQSNTLNCHTENIILSLDGFLGFFLRPHKHWNLPSCCFPERVAASLPTAPGAAEGGGSGGLLSFSGAIYKTPSIWIKYKINTAIKLFLLPFSLVQQACPKTSACKDYGYYWA